MNDDATPVTGGGAGAIRSAQLASRSVSLADAADRWPRFTDAAARVGFTSVYALPMRLRNQRIGGLNLSAPAARRCRPRTSASRRPWPTWRRSGCCSNARDTVRTSSPSSCRLDSRVVIEQAKGVLAEFGSLDMDQAFQALRRYARDGNHKLSQVAEPSCAVPSRSTTWCPPAPTGPAVDPSLGNQGLDTVTDVHASLSAPGRRTGE